MRYRLIGLLCLAALPVLQAVQLGQPAPSFSLQDSSGHRRSLAQNRGRVVFINFWASWCAPCQQELPELNRLAAENPKVRVLAINVDENRSSAEALLGKLGLTKAALQVLWDKQSKVVSAYNIEAMPASFVIDRKGTVRFIHSGFHAGDPQTWRQEISSCR